MLEPSLRARPSTSAPVSHPTGSSSTLPHRTRCASRYVPTPSRTSVKASTPRTWTATGASCRCTSKTPKGPGRSPTKTPHRPGLAAHAGLWVAPGLQWQDIDLEAGILVVKRAWMVDGKTNRLTHLAPRLEGFGVKAKTEVCLTPVFLVLDWWLWADLNRRHHDYESCALTN